MKPQMATVQVLDTIQKTKEYVALTTWIVDYGKKTMIVVMPDASADATVIFRLIVSIILITIMSIVMMMMMMVVVYQCLLMVFDGF